ncbi:hypothetical protein O7607_30385 [Micromonospora sp. WMMA1949]|uniref:hypothetical protein n=1 Tax=Micromonospora sp. WMMA1949 TaxID=3015162 RepID=UPI0022B63EA7|nr:hypothetical protein [Micromonospora sp. WMMA1949]MCZ7424110.1 hypothetical protein [Micromonospora sp. WMMA1949]MCZ7430069.1 hypothetical protein [Micromonospora sp. WMMA1949]MCZ7430080.1 hypothetical protein [Micromonospora sp. WMMA1949]
MAEPGWVALIAGLGGTAFGAALQYAQAAGQARRERRRERESWSREDRRHWIEQRQRLYLDTAASARRQLNSYVHTIAPILDPRARENPPAVDFDPSRQWRRSHEVLSEWGRLLTEVEFYGSDDVRDALNNLDVLLRILELAPFDDQSAPLGKAEDGYVEAVAQMRRDLGLSEGRKARMRSSFGFLSVDLDQPPTGGEDGDAPPRDGAASQEPAP